MNTTSSSTPAPAPGVGTDRRGLRVLSLAECLTRLAESRLGRVGFSHDGEMVILPVNHVVDGMTIAFRSTWGSKLQVAADVGTVAFEVDWRADDEHRGWSVLVQGDAELVLAESECERLDQLDPSPWVRDDNPRFWVRIRPSQVSGRELVAQAGP